MLQAAYEYLSTFLQFRVFLGNNRPLCCQGSELGSVQRQISPQVSACIVIRCFTCWSAAPFTEMPADPQSGVDCSVMVFVKEITLLFTVPCCGRSVPCHWHSCAQKSSRDFYFQSHALGSENRVAVVKHKLKFLYISSKFPM